jgi:hypothetical protein
MSEMQKSKNGFFHKKINENYSVMHNEYKNICIVDHKIHNHFPVILESLNKKFPNTVLWVGIDIGNDDFIKLIKKFIENGFKNPYINMVCPMGDKIYPSVCLSRGNNLSDNIDVNSVLNKVFDVIKQHKTHKGVCFINIKLTPKAVKFLKDSCFSHFKTDKRGKTIQTEITGELYVENVVSEDGKIIYMIDINTGSVKLGQKESVDVDPYRFNFHSHPKEAYVRHSVNKGWPSVTDYLGYLKLGQNTIFHCVASIEGLYVMSFTPYWSRQLHKVDKKLKKFVDKNFEIDQKKKSYSAKKYTKVINSIKYKENDGDKGNPIFKVEYFRWENAGDGFSVFFPQIGSSCLVSQKIVDNYNKIHG